MRDSDGRIQALQEVALAVNSKLDLDEVLPLVLERACALLSARKGSIMLVDEGERVLTIAVAYGLSDEVISETRVPVGEGVAGTVAATGETRCMAPGTREYEGETVDLPAALCVPLQVGERILGVLNVSDPEDREFGPTECQLAELFAAQSAVALQNARAYEEQERRAAELQALHDISLTLNQSLDLNDVLQQVLERATQLLSARQGSIMLVDESEQVLTIAVSYGLSREVVESTRVPVGEGVAGEVARGGKPRNLPAGERATESRDGRRRRLPAAMSVPLQLTGRVIGVLNVSERQDGGNFSDSELQVLTTLANQAAVAIRNAQLYDDVRQRIDELSALNEIARGLSSSLKRDEVLQRVLDNALRLLRCRKGSLMLIQTEEAGEEFDASHPLNTLAEPDRYLEIVVAHGLPEDVVRQTRIRLGEGIAGRVAESGRPETIAAGKDDVRSASAERSASLSLPLVVKDHVIGVLNLSEQADGEFDEEGIELAVTLAAQAATAIENAQLYDDLREQFVHSIRVIANAIDARDPYTRGHSDRVASYSRLIAEELEMADQEVEDIYYAGLLHDVGKIGIRDNILLKEGHLTDEEFSVMQQHPVKSAEIIYPVKQLRHILPGLRHHHERFSARGYPDGLHEAEIPLMARVIGVADTYDAMTSDRPYRRALPRRVALEELARNRGLQFDPECVNAFLRLVEKGVIGEIDGQGPSGEDDVRAALDAVEAGRSREG